jgi:hypothetical protein
MTAEQKRDLELLKFQYLPDQGNLLAQVIKDDRYDMTGAVFKGYLLGYMHGKRAERARRVHR